MEGSSKGLGMLRPHLHLGEPLPDRPHQGLEEMYLVAEISSSSSSTCIDVRAASFHSDLCKKQQSAAAWLVECSQTGCVCMEGHASCRWKGSKMVWPWHAVQAVLPWYIVLSSMLSNMLASIVNIINYVLLQPMHTERERI
jgi:hypothetical protein